jgi:hypothetical protein
MSFLLSIDSLVKGLFPMSMSGFGRCGRLQKVSGRRDFLSKAGLGCGMLALSDLLARESSATEGESLHPEAQLPLNPLAHFPAKAKSIIWLFMEGAPSSVDLFDPKPELDKHSGEQFDIPTFNADTGPLMKSPFSFRRYGDSGTWVSDQFPCMAAHVDELAFIKSLYTDSVNHVPALYQMNTGLPRPGFPAAGSWMTYGLGSENQNLPGFIVLGSNQGVKGGPLNWSSGFLPAQHQGTLFRTQGSPILNLQRPGQVTADDQRAQLDLMAKFNRSHIDRHPDNAELSARIESFELAYRMQTEAAELVDLSHETRVTQQVYGLDNPVTQPFGNKCLLARRLVEQGVRFVQVYHDSQWDAHSNLKGNHSQNCAQTDLPIAGLLTDLKARGLLDSTLVIWGGEFGRMPVSQGNGGRDHNPHGFMAWMAGAGIKSGASHGETDEFGYKAVVDPASVHDLHATMLHLMGLDHKRLTYLHNGRRYRLTDVAGDPIRTILA